MMLALPAHADDPAAPSCVDAANAGQPLRRGGHLRAARTQFLRCAADDCPSPVRDRCLPWLREIDAALPTVVVRARDAAGADLVAVKVIVDGVAVANEPGVAMVLDPGTHQFRYETPEGQSREEQVVVAQGEKNRVLVVTFTAERPEPQPVGAPRAPASARPRVSPVVAYGIAGLGLVALGTFAIFEVKAHRGYSDLEGSCARTRGCAPAELDAVRRDGTVAVIAGGVGVAALAASVFLLLWRDRPPVAAQGPSHSAVLWTVR